MFMRHFSAVIATSVLSFTAISTVQAYQSGDVMLRVGPAMVDPQDDSSELSINGVTVPSTGVEVDGDTQLGLTLSYFVNPHLAIGLLAATPFQHTVTLDGILFPGVDVADVKHLPPTLSVQYFPLGSDSAWQPYGGIGLNYTTFFSEELSGEFEAALGTGDIELDDSWGLALEVGMDYQLTPNVSLNAAVWYADIDTSATIELDSGLVIETDVDIDPLVYMLGVGFRF